MVEEITNNLMKKLENQLISFENEIYKKINDNYDKMSKMINEQIDSYTQKIKIKILNDIDEDLRKKPIDFKKLEELKIPSLVNLLQLNNSNYLINLILLSLANMKKLIIYFLSNEDTILSKSKKDPTGIYIAPSFLTLLDHIWKGSKNIYSPDRIHEKLKKLMYDYNSKNPGEIIKFIILQLHKELISNECIINEPDWEDSDKKALEKLVNYFYVIRNKISEDFFSSVRIKRLDQQQKPEYLYHNIIVVDLFLDNINSVELSLEQNFKALFFDKNDIIKYRYNNRTFFSKEIKTIPRILIININRPKNQKKILKYPKNLDSTYLFSKKPNQPDIFELYSVIMSKKIIHEDVFYGYIKNFVNEKWYLYNSKEIKFIDNEDDVIDGENCLLLIYQKKHKINPI